MSKSLLAADRCQSAVPVGPAEVVRGWCFTATCRAWPGLLAPRPVFASPGHCGSTYSLGVERGAPVPVGDQAAGVAGEDPVCEGSVWVSLLRGPTTPYSKGTTGRRRRVARCCTRSCRRAGG